MIPGSANPLLLKSAAGGLQIERSLRFNSVDSAYLSRTPAVAGNRRTWTWAGWVKRAKFGNYEHIFAGTGSSPSYAQFYWSPSEQLVFDNGGSDAITTTQVFRDASAWYHIVLIFDTTQGTAADRMRMYVNGSQITSFSSSSYPSQNSDGGMNQASIHYIGKENVNYSNFYLANIHFIDGQALTPSSFTETDATTGQLIPKTYTGSYGANGFNLLFADNSSNTASTLGKDTSPNGNNWTPNNLSVTAGAGNDSLVDSPINYGTDTGVGGEVRGNYATLNPLKNNSNNVLSNGNLTIVNSASSTSLSFATIALPKSGKYYFEGLASANAGSTTVQIGIFSTDHALTQTGSKRYWYLESGSILDDNTTLQTVATYGNGNIIGVAYNADANTVTWYKDGTPQGTAVSVSTSYDYVFGTGIYKGQWDVNFGQRAFAYTAPSGFKALCTQNLPAPLVTKSNTVFDVATWSGTGATQSITFSSGLAPDFVWIKARNAVANHVAFDIIRGANKAIYPSLTNAEDTYTATLTSFNSSGFTLGYDDWSGVNQIGRTYVGWAWDAGTSTVSNTQGSITSQVRANASAGFSVVTYTGPGPSNNTVGHGLGVAPELIITKNRDRSIYWIVYTKTTGKDAFLRLNTTSAFTTAGGVWGTAEPTSTVFGGVGTDFSNGYTAGERIVSYCFAPVVGNSSFGSYAGNGSADGPFVYTGFRPRWILYKRSDSGTGSGNWNLVDTSRSTYNVSQTEVIANDSIAEFTSSNANMDILSNGFKIRTTDASRNESAKTFIYAAFAEAPLNYSRAR